MLAAMTVKPIHRTMYVNMCQSLDWVQHQEPAFPYKFSVKRRAVVSVENARTNAW